MPGLCLCIIVSGCAVLFIRLTLSIASASPQTHDPMLTLLYGAKKPIASLGSKLKFQYSLTGLPSMYVAHHWSDYHCDTHGCIWSVFTKWRDFIKCWDPARRLPQLGWGVWHFWSLPWCKRDHSGVSNSSQHATSKTKLSQPNQLRSPGLTQSIRKASALGTVTGSEGWAVQTCEEEAPGFLFVAFLLKGGKLANALSSELPACPQPALSRSSQALLTSAGRAKGWRLDINIYILLSHLLRKPRPKQPKWIILVFISWLLGPEKHTLFVEA